MCGIIDNDPSASLSRLLYSYGISATAADIRKVIAVDWPEIKRLAHFIHNEESDEEAKLKKAARIISALDSEGIINAVKGRASPEVCNNFKLLASKVK